jgi:TetR/AcrR family fatty acid metabolism transcriptional regulator
LGQNGKAAAGEPREAERRRTILRAAIDVFAEKGYHGCRIADVAQQAGVAYGLVYHYFQNKDELLKSVFEVGWSGFVARIREAAEGERTLSEKIRQVCEVAFEAYRVDPRGVRVIIFEVARSPAGEDVNRKASFDEVIGICEAMFVQAQARGELRSGLDPKLAALMLFGAVEYGLTGFVIGMFDANDRDVLERMKAQVAQTLLSGVQGAKPARGASKPKPERRGPSPSSRREE